MRFFLLAMLITISSSVGAASPREAYTLSSEGKAVIVDVREFEEISHGMIRDALWFPKSKMSTDPEAVKSFKEIIDGKKVYLYCKSGKRAEACQQILEGQGISAESIGGFDTLKDVLPVEGLHQKLLRLRQSSPTGSGRKNQKVSVPAVKDSFRH